MDFSHFSLNGLLSFVLSVLSALSAAALIWTTHKSNLAKRIEEQQARLVTVLEKESEGWQNTADGWKAAHERALVERKDSDARHETVIAEYRNKIHAVRNDLQSCTGHLSEARMENETLKARTDFKPVLEFQQTWYAENRVIQQQTLDTLTVVAPLLVEVKNALVTMNARLPETSRFDTKP